VVQRSTEERLARLEAVHEIQNLMGRMQYYIASGDSPKNLELFALKTPGVSAEIGDRGVFEGAAGLKKIYVGIHGLLNGDRMGGLIEHDLTTPVIEVAGDGKTAKGVWTCPGVQSSPDPQTDELQAYWIWVKYKADFVQEDGQWKIWHFKVYANFVTPFDEGWVKCPDPAAKLAGGAAPAPGSEEFPADRPTTYHRPYDPKKITGTEPAPPEPYKTWQ
jgi:hypothetical protein